MNTFRAVLAFLSVYLAQPAYAQTPVPTAVPACTPPPGGKCLSQAELQGVEQALQELDNIHKVPAVVTTTDNLTIITDWQNRVYVNGGEIKAQQAAPNQISLKLTLGPTVDREMAVTLPTQVYYRDKPVDPMFRLRFRAQAGILVPQLLQSATGNYQRFWDAGLSLDFFHYDNLNAAVYAGVFSLGGGLGYDLTRNFGPYVGYALVYDGLKSSVLTGIYFSFN